VREQTTAHPEIDDHRGSPCPWVNQLNQVWLYVYYGISMARVGSCLSVDSLYVFYSLVLCCV